MPFSQWNLNFRRHEARNDNVQKLIILWFHLICGSKIEISSTSKSFLLMMKINLKDFNVESQTFPYTSARPFFKSNFLHAHKWKCSIVKMRFEEIDLWTFSWKLFVSQTLWKSPPFGTLFESIWPQDLMILNITLYKCNACLET